jgi:hypothetical protein
VIDFLREVPLSDLLSRQTLAPTEGPRQQNGGSSFMSPATNICHFEGAPRRSFCCDKPGARLRNLLSASSWHVANPCLSFAGGGVSEGVVRLPRPASRDPTVDSSALQPVG